MSYFNLSKSATIHFIVLILLLLIVSNHIHADKQSESKNLIGHGGPVNAVAISPDGTTALSGSLDYAVMMWDISSAKTKNIKRFIEHQGAVSEVTFLPSGQHAISSGDDGNVYLWDLAQKKLLHKFIGHKSKVVSIAVSNDAKLAATSSWDGSIRLWDLDSKKSLQTIKIHNESVNGVLISADKKTLYSGGYDGKIRSWDSDTGNFISVLHTHGWPINIMRWLPEQKQFIFGTTNGDAQILDIASKKISKILIPHEKPVLGLAVSEKHNLVATGGNDGVIRVWDSKDWSLKGETRNILGPVWALAFTADGKSLYYGSLDDDVKFWSITKNEDDNLWIGHKPRRFQVKTGMTLGELQFARKCSICHTLKSDDANRAGPSLHKVFGREAGTLAGYAYSESLLDSTIVWNEKTLDDLFAKGPHKIVPGTKMPLQKVSDNKKRKALIEYLKIATK